MRSALGALFTNPDFSNAYQNHLRTSALIARKPFSARALGISKRIYDCDWGEPCYTFYSRLTWSKKTLTAQDLHDANIFGHSIWDTVTEFRATGSCSNTYCDRFMRQVNWERNLQLLDKCTCTTSIWRATPLRSTPKMCVEGNKRLHQLAWAMQVDRGPEPAGWECWIGQRSD